VCTWACRWRPSPHSGSRGVAPGTLLIRHHSAAAQPSRWAHRGLRRIQLVADRRVAEYNICATRWLQQIWWPSVRTWASWGGCNSDPRRRAVFAGRPPVPLQRRSHALHIANLINTSISESTRTRWLFLFLSARADRLTSTASKYVPSKCMRSLNALFCSQRLGMFNLVCHNGPRATGYLLSGAHRRHAESYAFQA
jgi:hypothetical protein